MAGEICLYLVEAGGTYLPLNSSLPHLLDLSFSFLPSHLPQSSIHPQLFSAPHSPLPHPCPFLPFLPTPILPSPFPSHTELRPNQPKDQKLVSECGRIRDMANVSTMATCSLSFPTFKISCYFCWGGGGGRNEDLEFCRGHILFLIVKGGGKSL